VFKILQCLDIRLTHDCYAVSLTRRARFTPRNIFWYSFLLEADQHLDLVRLEGLGQKKTFNEVTGDRTRDLPVCRKRVNQLPSCVPLIPPLPHKRERTAALFGQREVRNVLVWNAGRQSPHPLSAVASYSVAKVHCFVLTQQLQGREQSVKQLVTTMHFLPLRKSTRSDDHVGELRGELQFKNIEFQFVPHSKHIASPLRRPTSNVV
jgi:hypothetical protein